VEFTYREYTKDPLSAEEIREVLAKLGVGPRDVLRSRDAAKHDVGKAMSDADPIEKMPEFSRPLQRPIGVVSDRAVVGRPAEALLALL